MMPNRTSRVLLAIVGVGLPAAACSLNPKEDPTRYYVLASLDESPGLYEAAGLTGDSEEAASLSSGPHLDIAVGVGPVTVPGYLTHRRIVTRQSDSELEYLETERWAQPLRESLQRVVAANLGTLLWTDGIVLHPWYATERPEYSVGIDITRFERGPDGAASIQARWAVSDVAGVTLEVGTFARDLPADSQSMASTVGAQNRLLAAMSREIADAIRRAAT